MVRNHIDPRRRRVTPRVKNFLYKIIHQTVYIRQTVSKSVAFITSDDCIDCMSSEKDNRLKIDKNAGMMEIIKSPKV